MNASVAAGALVCASWALLAAASRSRRRSSVVASLAENVPAIKASPVQLGPRSRLAAMFVASAFGGFVAAGPVGGLAGVGSVVAGRAILRRRAVSRRRTSLEAQLGDAVVAMSAALRAGMSLVQAVGLAARETEEPLASTLRDFSERVSLGEPFEEALGRWSSGVGGDDCRLAAGVLLMHRRTGGDLPLVLDQVATTLRERHATAREVRALTAQARLSGAILGALPVAFFLFLSLTSRREIEAAFSTSTGIGAVVIGLLMQSAAFLWIRHLLKVT